MRTRDKIFAANRATFGFTLPMVPAAKLGGAFRTYGAGLSAEIVVGIPDLDPAVWLAFKVKRPRPTSDR
jgi:hypothetical protein